jgi:hypothetical protein
MSPPKGYDMAKFAEMGYPQAWLDYFLGWTEDEENPDLSAFTRRRREGESSLYDITEEQVEDPNFWINL